MWESMFITKHLTQCRFCLYANFNSPLFQVSLKLLFAGVLCLALCKVHSGKNWEVGSFSSDFMSPT